MSKLEEIIIDWRELVELKINRDAGRNSYNSTTKVITFNFDAIGLIHELGHFLDDSSGLHGPNLGVSEFDFFRLKIGLPTPRIIQKREVNAWRYALDLAVLYQIDVNVFFTDLSDCLKTYDVSQKRISMIVNGMKKRIERLK